MTLLNPSTLKPDRKPATLGELRWFARPARRTTLLQPFLAPEQWSRSTRPATLVTRGQSRTRSAAPDESKVSTTARKAVPGAGLGAKKMSPETFDPAALLARKDLDPAQLKLVPAFGKSTTGLRIFYRGQAIGYYERDAVHRSMQLQDSFHGKGIGTIAYLVMAKLFHDSRQGLLDSDLSAERAGHGNLSPQAQKVWRRFVDGGFAEAHRSGSHTIYQIKQSAIDRVDWSRFTPFLARRAP